MRRAILDGTVANGSLAGRTVTGGVLNVLRARETLAADCLTSENQHLAITAIFPRPTVGPVTVLTDKAVLPEGLVVSVINIVGQVVVEPPYAPVFSGTAGIRVDLTSLPAGYYVISLDGETLHAHAPIVVH